MLAFRDTRHTTDSVSNRMLLTSVTTAWHRVLDAALLPTCPADVNGEQTAVQHALSYIHGSAVQALGKLRCPLQIPEHASYSRLCRILQWVLLPKGWG